jgi:hypothetical protein
MVSLAVTPVMPAVNRRIARRTNRLRTQASTSSSRMWPTLPKIRSDTSAADSLLVTSSTRWQIHDGLLPHAFRSASGSVSNHGMARHPNETGAPGSSAGTADPGLPGHREGR